MSPQLTVPCLLSLSLCPTTFALLLPLPLSLSASTISSHILNRILNLNRILIRNWLIPSGTDEAIVCQQRFSCGG